MNNNSSFTNNNNSIITKEEPTRETTFTTPITGESNSPTLESNSRTLESNSRTLSRQISQVHESRDETSRVSLPESISPPLEPHSQVSHKELQPSQEQTTQEQLS